MRVGGGDGGEECFPFVVFVENVKPEYIVWSMEVDTWIAYKIDLAATFNATKIGNS